MEAPRPGRQARIYSFPSRAPLAENILPPAAPRKRRFRYHLAVEIAIATLIWLAWYIWHLLH